MWLCKKCLGKLTDFPPENLEDCYLLDCMSCGVNSHCYSTLLPNGEQLTTTVEKAFRWAEESRRDAADP